MEEKNDPDYNYIIFDMLRDGAWDWVPLQSFAALSHEVSIASGEPLEGVAAETLRRLFGGDLMHPGDLSLEGFVPWSGSPDAWIPRILEQCKEREWQMWGEGCWFENGPDGDERARSLDSFE